MSLTQRKNNLLRRLRVLRRKDDGEGGAGSVAPPSLRRRGAPAGEPEDDAPPPLSGAEEPEAVSGPGAAHAGGAGRTVELGRGVPVPGPVAEVARRSLGVLAGAGNTEQIMDV